MFNKRDRNEVRRIRHERVRKKISGTPTCPVCASIAATRTSTPR